MKNKNYKITIIVEDIEQDKRCQAETSTNELTEIYNTHDFNGIDIMLSQCIEEIENNK